MLAHIDLTGTGAASCSAASSCSPGTATSGSARASPTSLRSPSPLTGKSIATIALDLAVLTWRWRCLPVHYLRYGLYRAGQRRRDVLAYLPETVLYYRLLPSASADEILLDDKSVTKALLGATGVRTPRTVGYITDRRVTWVDTATPAADLVIKPQRHSSGGEGVQVVARVGSGLRTLDDRPLDPADMPGTLMLEERVIPSPETAAWGGGASLNTFRVYTLASDGGGASVVGAHS